MGCLNPDHIIIAYDIADGDENFDIQVPVEQDYYYDFGIQVVWADVTNAGAFDGRGTKPSTDRIGNYKENFENDKVKMSRKVYEQFRGKWEN